VATGNPIPGTVSMLQLIPVVDALRAMGADVEEILARAKLPQELLQDVGGRVEADASFRLWQSAIEVTGEPSLGLQVAKHVPAGAAGAFEYMLRHSATLGESLARADRFVRVLDDLCCVAVERGDDVACFRIWREGGHAFPPADVERFFALCAAALCAEFPQHPLTEVRFSHRCAGATETYRRHFRCQVAFGSAHDELVFPAGALDDRARSADPGLGAVLETHVEQLLGRLPSEAAFLQQARRVLTLQLQEGHGGMQGLAKALHVSARTLRRRLDEHGYTYTSLLDELRRNLAAHYLERSDLSLEQVAEALGFADTSTFYRSFKRWTGSTPAQYRRDHPA